MYNKKVAGVGAAIFVSCLVVLSYQRGTLFRDLGLPLDSFKVDYLEENITDSTINARFQQWENIHRLHASQTQKRRVPDIIGIGVKKCGTGALIHFLGQHPLIKIPSKPETYFFTKYYERGMDYYSHLMPPAGEDDLIMEKTPYYFFIENSLYRIKNDMPNAKIILSLCDPVERAFSDFVFKRYRPEANFSHSYLPNAFHIQAVKYVKKFEDSTNYSEIAKKALHECKPISYNDKNCPFARGIYHTRVRMWTENFNKSQLLVLNGNKWITDPWSLIEQIEDFLGIPKLLLKKDFIKSPESGLYCLNRWWKEIEDQPVLKSETVQQVDGKELLCLGSTKGRTRNGMMSMHPDTYKILKSFYKPHNELLYGILNKNMNW